MVQKQYFNCRPLLDDKPTFYDGKGFEYYNGTHETVYLALESNLVLHKNPLGQFDDLLNDYKFGTGVYDPDTVVKVRPNEHKTLWDEKTGCEEDNKRCNGQDGREIVMFRNDNESMPLIYNYGDEFKDFMYCEDVCCEEFVEVLPPCDCEDGEICTSGCEDDCEKNEC